MQPQEIAANVDPAPKPTLNRFRVKILRSNRAAGHLTNFAKIPLELKISRKIIEIYVI
jgi:hypothetical protein